MSRAGRTSLRAAGAILGTVLLLAGAATGQTAATPPAGATNAKHVAWDGNRTLPVHLLPLRDEDDEPIIPTETDPLPY